VQPGPPSFNAAVASANWTTSLAPALTNQPDHNAWPVVGATYVLLHAAPEGSGNTDATLKFFDWAFAHGAAAIQTLDYVSLPETVVARIRAQWTDAAHSDLTHKAVAAK
jgi:phosphate transport system substrate-binding protein